MSTMTATASSTEVRSFGSYFDQYASKECRAYVEALVADGWERMGQTSCYGIVLRHPDCPGHVHKVAFRAKDDGWVPFVKYAKDNPNPHFPVIRGIEDHGDFFVADIEKLSEMGCWGEDYETSEKVASACYSDNVNRVKSILSELTVPMARAVEAIRDNFKSDWKIDLHPGNFMKRGETLVVTDPLAWRRGQ